MPRCPMVCPRRNGCIYVTPATRLIAFNIDAAAQDVVAWTKAGIVACIPRSASLGEIIERIVTATTDTTIANGSAVILFP